MPRLPWLFALTLAPTYAWALDICLPPYIVPGAPMSVTVTDARPMERVWFIRGTALGGSVCPPPLGGACLTVQGAQVVTSVLADPHGVATMNVTFPAAVPVGYQLAMQAAVIRSPSGGGSVVSNAWLTEVRADMSGEGDCASPIVCTSPDADADHVHDACDVCPDGDDQIDTDMDGIPDACDTGPDDLIARWTFDGGSTEDVTGNGHDATIVSGALGSGHVDGGLALDGSADWASVPESADFDITSLTVSAWVSPNLLDGYRGILAKAPRAGAVQDWGVYLYGSNLAVSASYPTGHVILGSPPAGVMVGMWHHVAVTVDGDTGEVGWYVDGMPIGTSLLTVAIPIHPSGLAIGTDGSFPNDFNGSLDDVRLWGRALAPAEILEVYTSP